jgi:glycoside/pentoside/hexuronide:cation symporter, GPH family
MSVSVRAEESREEAEERVPFGHLVAYAQMTLPLAVIGLPIAIYIPAFYSGTLGLNLAAVGIVLMLARFSDVITDPLIGRLSDRTRGRFGRRRPWIAAGVPLMALSAFMLFVPSEPVSLGYLLLWISAIYLGFTLITIPYGAWGAELSTDYRERSRVTGAREIFLLIGLISAILIPVVWAIVTGATEAEEGELNSVSREAMASLGWMVVILLPVCAAILFWKIREPAPKTEQTISFVDGLKAIMRNGPFRRVLVSTMVGALAGSLNAAVAILFYDHVLKLGQAGFVLILVLFGAAALGSPFWVSLGNRLGKHRALCVAVFLSMLAFSSVPLVVYFIVPVSPDFTFIAMFLITLVQGFAFGAGAILGASMLADVVDLDMMRSGEHRTGLLFAFLGFARKFFEAAGVGIALPLIAFLGFDPQAEAQTESGKFGIVMVYCLLPLCLWTVSALVIWNFPITAERLTRIREAYARRAGRRLAAEQGSVILGVTVQPLPAD